MKKKTEKMSKKRWIILGMFVAAFILIIILIIRAGKKRPDLSETGNVLSVEVTKGTIESGVSGTGTLAYSDATAICVPENLEIDEVLVSAGSSVSQGTLLATVDQTSLAACLSEVQEEISDIDSIISTEKSKTKSTKITAGVAGRVKEIYAKEDTAVTQLMKENGALMLISTDGYMAVDIENGEGLNSGDEVKVTDGEATVDGTVSSIENGTAVILFTDSKYAINAELTVTDTEEKEIGKANAYVHAPLKVVGTNGTVAAIKVSEGDSVSASATVITLEETSQTVEYQQAVKEREELVELLNTLISIQAEGGIVAQEDGVVESVNTEGSSAENSNSSQGSVLGDASGSVVAKEQSVENTAAKVTDEGNGDIMTMSSASAAVSGTKEAVNGTKEETLAASDSDIKTKTALGKSASDAKEETALGVSSTGTKTALEPPTGLTGGEGVIKGTTTSMEYASNENAAEWKTCTDQSTEVDAGTWYIRYKETDINAASIAVKVEVSKKEGSGSSGEKDNQAEESKNNTQNGNSTENQSSNQDNTDEKSTRNEQTAAGDKNTSNEKSTSNTKSNGAGQSSVSVKSSSSSASAGSSESDSEDSSAASTVELFTIASGEMMTVTMIVDELDILSMKEGLEAVVSVDAVEDQTFAGTITSVSNSTSGSGGVAQYSVEVTFEKTAELLEGMSASVEVILEKAEDVLVVPVSAISDGGKGSIVYTENSENTLAGEVEIETGLSDETYVEVVSGLSEGDTIYYQMAGSEDSNSSDTKDGFGGMPGGDFNGGGFDGERPERSERKGMQDNNGGMGGNKQ